ncbi:MAG: hypothetical protein VKK04_19460 [Synechococcales bacterium]|nr:hypothetical protein [Synechococcales bacterium]
MSYAFNIIGITPTLTFFNHQLKTQQAEHQYSAPEYVGAYRCTLDAFLESVETVPQKRGWDVDQVVDSVIQFWMSHGTQVRHWQERLADAGDRSLIVGRLATLTSIRSELESLFSIE